MATSITTLPIIAGAPPLQTLASLLPLHRAGHRYIDSKDGAMVAEVFSGAIGISAANELEARIVTAVNSHDVLVTALSKLLEAARAAHEPVPHLMAAFRLGAACVAATAALELAGAA